VQRDPRDNDEQRDAHEPPELAGIPQDSAQPARLLLDRLLARRKALVGYGDGHTGPPSSRGSATPCHAPTAKRARVSLRSALIAVITVSMSTTPWYAPSVLTTTAHPTLEVIISSRASCSVACGWTMAVTGSPTLATGPDERSRSRSLSHL